MLRRKNTSKYPHTDIKPALNQDDEASFIVFYFSLHADKPFHVKVK